MTASTHIDLGLGRWLVGERCDDLLCALSGVKGAQVLVLACIAFVVLRGAPVLVEHYDLGGGGGLQQLALLLTVNGSAHHVLAGLRDGSLHHFLLRRLRHLFVRAK